MIVRPEIKRFAIGLCLGDQAESSALAVVQAVKPLDRSASADGQPKLLIEDTRGLLQFPPHTPYMDIGTAIAVLIDKIELEQTEAAAAAFRTGEPLPKGARQLPPKRRPEDLVQIQLIINQTDVGEPVAKMIEEQARRKACRVVIRGQAESYLDGVYSIPKRDLAGGIQVALEKRTLRFVKSATTNILVKELQNYRYQPAPAGALNAESWRTQPNDDLVFAVGIASWRLRRYVPFSYEM